MKKFLTFFAMLCALLGFSPHASADIRLMGGGSGDWTTGILMNQVGSSNDYTCEVNITSSNKTIKVKDNGTWRGYKNNNSTWTASSFPASNTLSSTGATGDDITIDKAGTYVVTYNSSSNKLTISPVLYFVGNMTGWNLDTTKKFTCVGSVYTLTLASGISNPNSGDTGWKIWNGTWGYNFGSGGTDPTVGGNEVNAWFKAAANYETTTTSAVQIQFTLLSDKDGDATVDGKVKLISAGPTKPAAPTISASGNTVTITKTGSGDIWYTTNGDDPTKDTSTRTRYTASFTIERGKTTTVKAAVVSGGEWSDITSKNIYVGAAPTVKEITLYTRDDIKNGNSGRGTATAAGADGIWKVASVSIPSDANSGYWNSTLSVKVTYSDNTSAWYSTTQNTDVNTIQANGWKNTFVRSTWPVSSTANCGFFVENSGGKTVTVYARFIGDDLQISAVMPYNALTIGSSTPQITGYGIPSDSWNNYKDFSKVSDSPKSYEYVFTCGNANDNKEYVWYGLKINGTQYRPANLSLGESTYTFTAGAPSSSNQATIKGLTTGVNYALVLTETEMGLRLTITEAGVPKPVFTRAAESNVVTVNVPDGCTLHYTVNGGAEQTATSRVTLTIPTDGMTVSAYFTKDGETGETVNGSFDYYTAPQRWASKEWSLSDDGIMPRNSVKYFYMSRYQNDDRVSPEWELVKNGDTYTLDYFMCIPAAEFRLRRIAKDNNGAITYRDFGLDAVEKITPTSIGATSATVGTADAPKTVSKNYTVYGGSYDNKSRGYAWDLGYSLVSVKVTDATDGNNAYGNNTLQMTLSVDFSHPSTANVAPIK